MVSWAAGYSVCSVSYTHLLNAPSVSTLSQGAAIPQTALCHRPTEGDYLWVVNSKTQQVTKDVYKRQYWPCILKDLNASRIFYLLKLNY